MLDPKYIDDMLKRFSDNIPPAMSAMKEDLERNFRAAVQATLAKFDLVTREEFDTQVAVLAKTRAKIEALEKKLAEFEKMSDKSSASTNGDVNISS